MLPSTGKRQVYGSDSDVICLGKCAPTSTHVHFSAAGDCCTPAIPAALSVRPDTYSHISTLPNRSSQRRTPPLSHCRLCHELLTSDGSNVSTQWRPRTTEVSLMRRCA